MPHAVCYAQTVCLTGVTADRRARNNGASVMSKNTIGAVRRCSRRVPRGLGRQETVKAEGDRGKDSVLWGGGRDVDVDVDVAVGVGGGGVDPPMSLA